MKTINLGFISIVCGMLIVATACSDSKKLSELRAKSENSVTNVIPEHSEPVRKQKNIIFILADDMGYGDLGVYGQTKIETPNLDQLAKEGILFSQFYSGATVCAPSRSVLMTGQHLGHTPIRGNGRVEMPLLPEDETVAEVLKSAGYHTGIIGKWGLGDEGSTGLPNKQGFDYFYGYTNQVHAHNHYPEWLWRNDEKVYLANKTEPTPIIYSDFIAGVTKPENRKEYAGDLFFEESEAFIKDNADKPFFLYLSLIQPHANNESDHYDWAHGMEVPSYGKYADKEWPDTAKGYAAMVDHIDQGVGRIMYQLHALGIENDTIVMFTSDNGPHSEGGNDPEFFDSNGPLRGQKRDLYDGGIRVPMIAWGPGTVISNHKTNHIAYFGDFMATAADIAGVSTPKNTDSISFLPTILGEGNQSIHDFLYWEFYEWGSAQAIRKNNYKAVRKPMFTGPIEIYDVQHDIGETNDLAAQRPDLVAAFEKSFTEAHVSNPKWSIK